MSLTLGLSVLIHLSLLDRSALAANQKITDRCQRAFSGQAWGSTWNLELPASLSKIKLTPQLLMESGAKPSIARRMVENREWAAPLLVSRGRSQQTKPKAVHEWPRPRGTVSDVNRGYRRRYPLKTMRTMSEKDWVTVYRGVQTDRQNRIIKMNGDHYLGDDFDMVGNVIWVAEEFEQAYGYARTGGYILQFKVPGALVYQVREGGEAFLHPEQITNLTSYLDGAYRVTAERTTYEYSEFSGEWIPQTGTTKVKWIPFTQLPKGVFQIQR